MYVYCIEMYIYRIYSRCIVYSSVFPLVVQLYTIYVGIANFLAPWNSLF